MSLRNVVTSCGVLRWSSTATVPCSIPTGTVRLNRRRTWSGGAAVVRSKSWFSRPSKLSRIAPPTHQVSNPASSRRFAMLSTSGGIGRRAGNVIERGTRNAERGTSMESRPAPRGTRCCSAFRLPRSAFRSATQHRSPVDVQDLARDVAREVGAEKHNRARDLLRGGDPPQRDALLDLPLPPSPLPAERFFTHLRIHPPGSDAVHRDPGRELAGERLREGDDRALGGGVVGVERLPPLPRGGRDQHDAASVAEPRDRGAAHVEQAVEIGAPGALPLCIGHRGERHVVGRPHPVVHDEDVEPAQGLRCLPHRPPGGRGITEIGLDCYRPLPCLPAPYPLDRCFRIRPAAAVSDGDARARARQQQRRRPPHAPAAPRHDGALAAQVNHRPSRNLSSTISHTTCSMARCSSWIRAVSSDGTTSATSANAASWPPLLPSRATTVTPRARAACAARITLGLSPLVECSDSTSPGRARASSWRANTSSDPPSF